MGDIEIARSVKLKPIMEVAESLNIEIEEKEIKVSEISNFDSLFISGTSVAILPISQVDDINFDVNNEILRKIMKIYDDLLKEKL